MVRLRRLRRTQIVDAAMIRIATTQAVFEAIARTPPVGSVSYENKTNERGERLISLAPNVVNRLRFLRRPGESLNRPKDWR
jgi:hypothetical protein